MGVINIACGPTGLVWAITWDGHAMVRTHVSRDAVYGEGFKKAETVNSHCDAMVMMMMTSISVALESIDLSSQSSEGIFFSSK